MSGPDVIVTTEHLRSVPRFSRKPGFCIRWARVWFKRHNLDFKDFLRNGIPASSIEAVGDPLAMAVVHHARNMEAARGKR